MKLLWALVRPVLFFLDPERAHAIAMGLFSLFARFPGADRLVSRRLANVDPRLRTSVAGIELPTPVGLGAGFDKDARMCDVLHAIGFGFVEVGTLTAHPQPGNPRPRLFRLPADRALINRMGFNNRGSDAAARTLRHTRPRGVLGINIGKSKSTPNEIAVDDYLMSFERLYTFADYVTVNVSSPNTQGLRELQHVESLQVLLTALLERGRALATETGTTPIPIFVKIAPDMTPEQAAEIVELAVEIGLDGIIATNTTVSRDGLLAPSDDVASIGAGGLSGAPLTQRSRAFVAHLYQCAEGRLPIIGVGGIMNGDDAWEMIRAGASAVQVYTGFIYGGPTFVRDIHQRLTARLDAEGFANISEVVGSLHRQ